MRVIVEEAIRHAEDRRLRALFAESAAAAGHEIVALGDTRDAGSAQGDALLLWNRLAPSAEARGRVARGAPVVALVNDAGVLEIPTRRTWMPWRRACRGVRVLCTSAVVAQSVGRQTETLPPVSPLPTGPGPLLPEPGRPLRVALLSDDHATRGLLDEALALMAEGRAFAGTVILDALEGAHAAVQPVHPGGVWPLTGAEALVRGVPLVVEAGGPLDPLVKHGVSALAWQGGRPKQLANRLSQLVNEPERALRVGTAGQAASAVFVDLVAWTKVVLNHLGAKQETH